MLLIKICVFFLYFFPENELKGDKQNDVNFKYLQLSKKMLSNLTCVFEDG